MENNEKSAKTIKTLRVIMVMLLLIIAGLTVVYFQQKQQAKDTQEILQAQKDSISNNLLRLMNDYSELETTNDTLNQKLQKEQEHAKKLYAELQSVKQISYAKIK
ncbi:MAG TPA: hypothetical protein PKO42_03115, partial [Tenuifilaceae bacterium]|nr:hypothetical protein [Tenuifilaceae bacterium]